MSNGHCLLLEKEKENRMFRFLTSLFWLIIGSILIHYTAIFALTILELLMQILRLPSDVYISISLLALACINVSLRSVEG